MTESDSSFAARWKGSSARRRLAEAVGPRGRAMVRRVRREPSVAAPAPGLVVTRSVPEDRPRVPWPLYPPPRYLGQLDPAFQAAMAAERAELTEADCDFYHSVDLPDGRTIQGPWDLRGHEADYLGGVDLAGRRVLELGPASGALTFWMEDQRAEVVCLDAGFDVSVDLVPYATGDLRAERMDIMQTAGAAQNAWWYVARARGSRAKMVYAPIYELPGDLGRFDVSVFGSILLHLRRPFDALEQAARVTDRTMVVTEVVDEHLAGIDDAVVRWNPARERWAGSLWWSFTPQALQEMLLTLGFPNSTVTMHTQRHHDAHDMSGPGRELAMFTVVAHR